MSESDIARAVALAGVTEDFPVIDFSGSHWSAWTLPDALEARYLAVFDAAREDLAPKLAHLGATVAMAACRDRPGTVLHLKHAFASGASRAELCEVLSYLLLPCGGNTLIEAVSFWEDAARARVVPPPY